MKGDGFENQVSLSVRRGQCDIIKTIWSWALVPGIELLIPNLNNRNVWIFYCNVWSVIAVPGSELLHSLQFLG